MEKACTPFGVLLSVKQPTLAPRTHEFDTFVTTVWSRNGLLSPHLVPDGDRSHMRVDVTVAVPRPEEVDRDAVAAEFPYGTVTVTPVQGGLRTPNGTDYGPGRDHLIVAVAVVAVGT